MQLAAAAVFLLEAVYSVGFALVYDNRASMLRELRAEHLQVPAGVSIEQIADASVTVAIGFVAVLAAIEVVAASGSLLRWRWMFWVALVLFGLGGLSAMTSLPSLANSGGSSYPRAVLMLEEALSLAAVMMFVWMVVAALKFGPWAMRRPQHQVSANSSQQVPETSMR